MQYKSNFRTDFELGFKLSKYPLWVVKSSANDMCPSFYFKLDSAYYILWVAHAVVEKREDETSNRYTVVEEGVQSK